jgi:hypothetical protein
MNLLFFCLLVSFVFGHLCDVVFVIIFFLFVFFFSGDRYPVQYFSITRTEEIPLIYALLCFHIYFYRVLVFFVKKPKHYLFFSVTFNNKKIGH